MLLYDRTARYWYQFRSGDLSLYDEPCSERPQVVDDYVALKVAIQEENRQTCGAPAEIVRHHLNRIGKAYKLGLLLPYIMSRGKVDLL